VTALTRDQRALRGQLIAELYRRDPGGGYLAAIEAGARQFREGQGAGRVAGPRPAASQKAIAETVAQAVRTASDARKAAKRMAKRATAEAAAARVLQERRQLAARFTETAIGRSLRESSGGDLAAIAATALSGTGQPGPAARPVAEMTVNPQALDLEDLGLAATAGTAGNSPFWGGSPVGASPFWRGLQVGGASKGTADA
jgi:hypothetical protein